MQHDVGQQSDARPSNARCAVDDGRDVLAHASRPPLARCMSSDRIYLLHKTCGYDWRLNRPRRSENADGFLLRNPATSSGQPWSGQSVYWMCQTDRSCLLDEWCRPKAVVTKLWLSLLNFRVTWNWNNNHFSQLDWVRNFLFQRRPKRYGD